MTAITPTVELWGFEFRWRASGSAPLEYRKAGGCRHDWKLVPYDHPLVAALRAATTNPGPVETPVVGCSDCNGYGYHGHTNPALGDRCSTCEGTGLAPDSGREATP